MNTQFLPGRAARRAPQLVPPRQYARVAARCGYLIALIGTVVTHGIPADRLYQAAWIVAGLIAFAIDRPWRGHLRVVVDWLPLVAALVVYDHTRGLADELGLPVRVHEPAAVESWLFGGTIPTVWLQERLLGADGERPGWTMITAVVYTSHFLVPWLLAALLYLQSRSRWAGYMRRVLLLSYFGLITYILVPAAPPWYASEVGVLPEGVGRVTGFGFGVVPIDVGTRWLEAQGNPVAALPSLHSAFALLVAVALWPIARRAWIRALLVAFPLAMAFTLVYGGEHYLVDVLLGWGYVGLAVLAARAWEARRGARRAPQVSPPAPAASPASPSRAGHRGSTPARTPGTPPRAAPGSPSGTADTAGRCRTGSTPGTDRAGPAAP
ncbi:inositol phosphorylceramide synthase [Rhodococcus ruber]|nr:inositol phosphorylceramide synthase [Rhodococcus ruber]